MKVVDIAHIEGRAHTYAAKRNALRELTTELQEKIAELHRKHMPGIRKAVEAATDAEIALRELVENAPELFVKPRTLIFHGIKVGFAKGKGGIEFDDADKVVSLIHKHYEGVAADRLLHITEKPDKDALSKLTVAELKKLGCELVAAGDAVVVKSTDSEIDKVVSALLKSAVDEATKQEGK